MSADDPAAAILDDMDEEFTHFGRYLLGHIGWAVNDGTRSPAEQHRLALEIYRSFTATHRTRLVWARWPVDLDQAWPAAPGTPLDFDLDPEGDVNEPLLVIVPE